MADLPSYLKIEQTAIPLRVKRHRKPAVRYSISAKSLNLSIPYYYSGKDMKKELDKLKHWAKNKFKSRPELLTRFITKEYVSGQKFHIRSREFVLELTREDRKTASASLEGNVVKIKLAISFTPPECSEAINSLLSRVFSAFFLKEINDRVHYLNQKYFGAIISKVRLKNNRTNWGSCSSKSNINLSSRLLLAPADVLDYVIIHELAHTREMNHSQRFWNIVASVMPDYRQKEEWLRQNGTALNF